MMICAIFVFGLDTAVEGYTDNNALEETKYIAYENDMQQIDVKQGIEYRTVGQTDIDSFTITCVPKEQEESAQ